MWRTRELDWFLSSENNRTVTLSRHADATKLQISAIYIPFALAFISQSSLNHLSIISQSRKSDLIFRVQRQITTVLTNVVVEHVKSRMNNAKTRQQ